MNALLSGLSILLTTLGTGVVWASALPHGVRSGTYHPVKEATPQVVRVMTEVVYARGPYGQQRLHRLMKDQNFDCQNMGEALFRCIRHEHLHQIPALVAEKVQNQFSDLEIQFAAAVVPGSAVSADEGFVVPQLVSVDGENFEGYVFHEPRDLGQVARHEKPHSFVVEADGTLSWQIQAIKSSRRKADGLPKTDTYLVYLPLTDQR